MDFKYKDFEQCVFVPLRTKMLNEAELAEVTCKSLSGLYEQQEITAIVHMTLMRLTNLRYIKKNSEEKYSLSKEGANYLKYSDSELEANYVWRILNGKTQIGKAVV